MSKKTSDGGAAFPRPIGHYRLSGCEYNSAQQGMSLRDYFAGQALAGLLACPDLNTETQTKFAETAYIFADAMLKARANEITSS